MPKSQDLGTFLRREVLRNKIKGVQPTQKRESAFERLSPRARFKKKLATLLRDGNLSTNNCGTKETNTGRISSVDDNSADGDLFSLFKERVKSNPKEERLSRFLAEESKEKILGWHKEYVTKEHNELKLLREELASLIAYEETLSVIEKHKLRMQKAKLNANIAKLEIQVNRMDVERRKVKLDKELPPPISVGEKRRLMRAARLVNEAKLGSEKLQKKRAREENDLELDGEERLRLGRRLKKPATAYTGSWRGKVNGFSSNARAEGILSPENESLLAIKKAKAESEKRKAVADFERVMREAIREGEDW